MKQKANVKQSRQRYSDEFKEQALHRAEQEAMAAHDGFPHPPKTSPTSHSAA
ncbi:hypothetical protein GCM10010981_21760 [Dyella nitratireducens]|uniref:Transposase n=1 Tax=Dyella nitratireducens TaxID=1849580 RepID=A0ABQ1FXD2_9GAMM|nr:hypothetical protein GCM10010981_21760 [Dyella nitratireducens]GLQ42761.1 hypothetical protein GCM10007902_26110 [Dyella nitratireducens]